MDFTKTDPDSNQIAALLYLTRKKDISILFKPTPILNHEGKFLGILGNLLVEASTPVITKIDANEVGSCFTIQNFNDIPDEFLLEIPLIIVTVKDTAWESTMNEIALCALPSLVPIPFGFQFESCNYNKAFIDEMKKIFFTDVIEQNETNSDTVTIVLHLMTSKTTSTPHCDPCCSATKNFRNRTAASGPFVEASLVGIKYTSEQASVKTFFRRNLTPARVVFFDEEGNNPTVEIPIHSTRVHIDVTTKNDVPTTADVSTQLPAITHPSLPGQATAPPPMGGAPPEFFAQLIQTKKSLQAPQLPPKRIAES